MDNERAHAPEKESREPERADKNGHEERPASWPPTYHIPQGLSGHGATSPADIPLTRGNVMFLQRTVGNRAVTRLLQMKGRQSQPGDPYEQEADRVAEQVLRMPDPSTSPTPLAPATNNGSNATRPAALRGRDVQRRAADEEDEPGGQGEAPAVRVKPISGAGHAQRQTMPEEEPRERHGEVTVRAKGIGGQGHELTPEVESQVGRPPSGGGEPLPSSVLSRFEPRFGQDFSGVRIHTNSDAAGSARALNARAYTLGQDIVFGAGEYAPGTPDGAHLLAHELTHVVQQQSAGGSPGLLQKQPGDDEPKVSYPIKVPPDVKTKDELDRYAEVLIFGKVMNYTWVTEGNVPLDVPALAKKGAIVDFIYPASYVAEKGGKKPGEVSRPKASNPDYDKTKGKEREEIDKEIERRFREGTGAPKDVKVTKADQSKTDMRNVYRDQVMNEKKQLEQLPAQLKELLLSGKKVFNPEEYKRLLQIAEKVKKFTPEDITIFRMAAVPTDNLDAFEKSVDLFLARKEELKKALDAQKQKGQGQQATQQKGQSKDPQSMQEAIEGAWEGFDSSKIGKMSEAEQYDVARQQAWKVTKAQLKYMKDHPGETALDFAKTATLMNTNETFEGIAKDIKEAADGDANSWARWAAGTGAGAKLSGWLLAVGAILYALSWLTGVGQLATILAFMTAMLASTIVLSAAESELRLKAASQAKTPQEFQTQATKSGVAGANVLVLIGLLVFAWAARFVAKTYFPTAVAKIKSAIARLRERLSLFPGRLAEIKAQLVSEVEAQRQKLLEAGEAAKKSSTQQADALEKMGLEEFVEKLESGGGDILQEATLRKGQKIPWKALSQTPEGLKAIESFKAQLIDGLRNGVPKEIDAIVKEQLGAVDDMLLKVKSAATPGEFNEATKGYDTFMSEAEVAKRGKAREEQMRSEKAAEALKNLEQEMKQFDAAAAEARKLIAKVAAEQPKVTTDLTEVAKANGAKMEGLDKAVKGEESLTRKIHDRVKPQDVKGKGLEKAVEISAGRMNDVLRYTMILDVKTYVALIESIKGALKAKGYEFVRLWNGWTKSDGTYMGVNATFKTKTGLEFELQFHTAESFKIKTKTHPIYEKARLRTTSKAEKVKLDEQQRAAYKGIKVPEGIEKVE